MWKKRQTLKHKLVNKSYDQFLNTHKKCIMWKINVHLAYIHSQNTHSQNISVSIVEFIGRAGYGSLN